MQKEIQLNNIKEAKALVGRYDENIKLIRKEFDVSLVIRGTNIKIDGSEEEVDKVTTLIKRLLKIIRKDVAVRRHEVAYAIENLKQGKIEKLEDVYLDKIKVSSKRQYVSPKTLGQKEYIDAIRKYDIVFGIGPAGTGKTYLAMAMAVSALQRKEVSRIILTRPALEAGESLGYLPGDLYEKVTPYLRPLYDALYDMMDIDTIQRYLDRGIIEVAPLAYMRGRTLNDAFIILDEAQNSTSEQMKMFLTRLGFDSKTVITGDITQSDLPTHKQSGLIEVKNLLKSIAGIKFVFFSGKDVVRHELVQKIIKAYEGYQDKKDK